MILSLKSMKIQMDKYPKMEILLIVKKEMALMAENKLMFDAAVQLLNKKLALKKYILSSER